MLGQPLVDILKLDFYVKITYKLTADKNIVSNQYTLFDSTRFSHSDFGYSHVKTYANSWTLLEENSSISFTEFH